MFFSVGRWVVLKQPPFSPDLGPRDCHLIPKLNREDVSRSAWREVKHYCLTWCRWCSTPFLSSAIKRRQTWGQFWSSLGVCSSGVLCTHSTFTLYATVQRRNCHSNDLCFAGLLLVAPVCIPHLTLKFGRTGPLLSNVAYSNPCPTQHWNI